MQPRHVVCVLGSWAEHAEVGATVATTAAMGSDVLRAALGERSPASMHLNAGGLPLTISTRVNSPILSPLIS